MARPRLAWALAALAAVSLSSSLCAQPNDACFNATEIAGDGLYNFDNTAATTDGVPDPACDFLGQAQIDHDLWYRWTALVEGQVTVSTCELTPVDTKIAVYQDGPCPTGSGILACNDDACDAQTLLEFPAVAGVSYLLRVGTFPGLPVGGPGAFAISTLPGFDDCNANGAPDEDDISNGDSLDNNFNGIPDECETNIVFEQITWLDNDGLPAQQFSDFGRLNVTAVEPQPGVINWLNATVNGNWVVQNAPIVEMTGFGNFHEYSVGFDLRNPVGVQVPSVLASVEITADPSLTGPGGAPELFSVVEDSQSIGLRLREGAAAPAVFLPTDPTDFLNDIVDLLWETVTRTDVPGVQEEDNHCAPGAVARSLAWMNDTYCLGFPDDCDSTSEIYDKLKDAMHMMTDPMDGTSDPDIESGTETLIDEKMLSDQLSVTLDTDLTPADALEALEQGKDVMGLLFYDTPQGGGHIYTITGITRCGDEYTIHYRDDENQGDDDNGDDGTKDSKHDNADGSLSGFGAGATWDGLVLICPTPKAALDALSKWLNGEGGGGGGGTEGLIDLLESITGGDPFTAEDVQNLLELSCNAVHTACALVSQLQEDGAADNVITSAQDLKSAAQQAKANIILFTISTIIGPPNIGLLDDALDALGDPQPDLDKIDGAVDCNDNEIDDSVDIANGTSQDVNDNGKPDECECLEDGDGSGTVDVDDLIEVIINWDCVGLPGECPGDNNFDGTVNVDDLVRVILAFGDC